MTERTSREIETLTIRIPIRLQRRGGRKLIMTPEGVAAPAEGAEACGDAGEWADGVGGAASEVDFHN
jgi:hypothetical protein